MSGWKLVDNPPFSFDPTLRVQQEAQWQQLQQQLPLGTVLTGTVFARTNFGVFYDAGIGFPVRMNIPEFGLEQVEVAGITARDEEGYPALGSTISGRLVQFDHLQQAVTTRL